MKLETKRLILRDIKVKDAESIRKHINNLDISKWLLVVPYPYTEKDTEEWVKHCKEEQKKKPRKSYDLGIVLKENKDEVIGGAGISNIKYEQGTAEMGYWLSQNYWRQGIMYEALKKIVDFAFNKLKLRRLEIPAYSKNLGSNKIAQKLGFKFEGKLREAAVCKATRKIHDENLYSLLRKEWKR